MLACPFQPPIARALDFGGRSVASRRFEQRPGLALSAARIAAGDGGLEGYWPIRAFVQLGVVARGKLRFFLPESGARDCPAGHWYGGALDGPTPRFAAQGEVELVWIECSEALWSHIAPEPEPEPHAAARCLACAARQEAVFLSAPAAPRLEALSRELARLEGRDARERLRVEAKTLEWLSLALEQRALAQVPSTQPCLRGIEQEALDNAARILEENLDAPHTLADLSRRVFLNEFKLKKGFRDRFHTTVFGYLRRKRVERARELLQSGRMSVIEAANAVGYSNPSHFARAFREAFGLNPRDLARR